MTEKTSTLDFPDRSGLKPLEAEAFPSNWKVRTDRPCGLVAHANGLVGFENTNVIIRVRGKDTSFPEHKGPLSILFARGGQESYEVDGRRFVMDEHSYMIHNFDQTVSSSIESPTSVESYTIGFWPGFVEDVLRSLVTPQDQLLDNPKPNRFQPVRFFDQLYRHDDTLSPLLARLVAAIDDPSTTKGWLEEQHYELLRAMLRVHRNISKEIEGLPALRAATRVELYRRLHRARDFMEASLDQPLTIPDIAREAWASPFHFLRQFKQVFGETPHQYLTRRRLEWAQMLLRNTDLPITDVCFTVGFESLGSFSGLFRKNAGLSPQKFRREHRRQQGNSILVSLARAKTQPDATSVAGADAREETSAETTGTAISSLILMYRTPELVETSA